MGHEVEFGCGKEFEIVLVEPDNVHNRPLVGHILHHDSDRFPAFSMAVFWEIPGGKRRPFMGVDIRGEPSRMIRPSFLSRRRKPPNNSVRLATLGILSKANAERTRSKSWSRKAAEVAIADQLIISARVGFSCHLDHAA